jgi:DNA-binding MarR family transcriptional regulator
LLGALLRIAYQEMMTDVVEPGLAEAGYHDVRPAHFPAMQNLVLRPRGVRPSELAAWARITKQSMGSLLDHLEAGGYVERTPDPSDGRAHLVRLTERGWSLAATTRRLVRQAEAAWAQRIGAARVEELREVLTQLAATHDDGGLATQRPRRDPVRRN